MNATTNEPTGATYRIETVTDILAIPPQRMGYFMTDLAMWVATGMATRDALADLGGELKMPTAMEWHDDGQHNAGVKVTGVDGATLLEMKMDGAMLGAAPLEMPTPPTPATEPTILERLRAEMDLAAIERAAKEGPLSQRLAVMAGQVQGMAEAIATGWELTGATDAAELRSLAAALAIASTDATKLETDHTRLERDYQELRDDYDAKVAEIEARPLTRDEKVARWMADDDTTPTDRDPDRDTDQMGNTWRNADGSPVRREG